MKRARFKQRDLSEKIYSLLCYLSEKIERSLCHTVLLPYFLIMVFLFSPKGGDYGPVHTNAFSFENAYLLSFRLSSTLQLSKTLIVFIENATLSRVVIFENGALSYQCGQRKWRLLKTLTSIIHNAKIVGAFFLSHAQMTVVAFSSVLLFERLSVDGENAAKAIV